MDERWWLPMNTTLVALQRGLKQLGPPAGVTQRSSQSIVEIDAGMRRRNASVQPEHAFHKRCASGVVIANVVVKEPHRFGLIET